MTWLLAYLALCAVTAIVVTVLGTLHGRSKLRQRPSQQTAEPDWVVRSMQIGGASDFQHDNGGAA